MPTPLILSHVVKVNADLSSNVSFERNADCKSTGCTLVGPTSMKTRLEQTPPLWAMGDGFLKLLPGAYVLTLVPWSEAGGKGTRGPEYKVTFNVPATPAPVPAPPKPAPATGDADKLAARVKELEAENAGLKAKLAEPWSFKVSAPDGFTVNVSDIIFTRKK